MRTFKVVLVAFLCMASSAFAQLKTPKDSPVSKVEQTVGLSTIKLEYSRPGVKDRKIFGELVPYGSIWRTGANGASTIEFSDDVTIQDSLVKAGKYALFTIPGEKEWTVIFNTETDQWGSYDYKQEEDVLRIKVPVEKLDRVVETFTIDFSKMHNNGTMINLSWENILISFEVKIETNAKIEAQIQKIFVDGPSVGSYYGAARYYLENGKDLDKALEWINIAIEKRPNAYWMIYRKALIEVGLGKTKEAIKSAELSLSLAKGDGTDIDTGYVLKNEALIKDLKSKK